MSSTSRFLGTGAAFGLAVGLLVGLGLAQPGRAAATTPSSAPTLPSGGAAIGAPAAAPAATNGASVASSGTAIAYPYFPGSPGIAPDHTIVVTGVGQADMRSDGSGRAAAQQTAPAAALADARAQAAEIASATGLSISGVLSVSASVSPYGPVPYAVAAPGGGPTLPVTPPTVPQPVYPQTLSVSVTVAYRVA